MLSKLDKLHKVLGLIVITMVAGNYLPGLWAPAFALVAGAVAAHVIASNKTH